MSDSPKTHPLYQFDDGTTHGPVLVGDLVHSKRHGVSGIVWSVSSDTVSIEVEDDGPSISWQTFRIRIDDLRYGAPQAVQQ